MIELRFHHALYAGEAVDEAAKVFAPHAKLDLRDDGEHWIVAVTADPSRERRVAGELANYALGLTVKRGAR